MTSNSQDILDNLKALSRRNEQLNQSLESLINNYQTLSDSEQQYQNLLKEFGLQEEVKRSQKDVKRFKMATLLYVVIKGFSELCSRKDAPQQLDLLDEIILMIQDMAFRHNLIKIPTIGDNILLVGGVETMNKTNPIDATAAAFEILRGMDDIKQRAPDCIWELGMGLHTGPVLARYASGKKLPYTVAGGNVLTSTRIGFSAFTGHAAMSPMTFELVKEFFVVRRLGKIPVKYSGPMDIYTLEDLQEEMMSDDPKAAAPWNKEFDLSYQRLQFMDIQEYILDMLEDKLPKNLYYHNVKHTIDVTTEVELIGWAEGLPEEDILLLKVAGLFHDSGHIVTYKGHEEESCKYAQEILPRFNYPQEKIDTIKRIIMATKLPHTPADTLEAVIQDSDLDYLGRSDFVPVSNMLYKELQERGSDMSIDQWNEMQIKFISAHQYYTKTALSLREVNKQSQIEHLKSLLPKKD